MNRYRNSLGTIAMIAAIVFGTTGLVSAQRTVAISGTYDLDRDVSDRVDDVVADVNVADNQRQDLVDKLDRLEGHTSDACDEQGIACDLHRRRA